MLFYVTFIDFGEFYGPGKDRKIKGQIEALKAGLGEVYYTYYRKAAGSDQKRPDISFVQLVGEVSCD